MFTSIFNDVLGPVMRGPSSSHTAGSYHIARVIRDLLAEEPREVDITFDPKGSYARTYVQQGVDQAFATGMMGWKLIDTVYQRALNTAAGQGVRFRFHIDDIPQADHPNYAIIKAIGASGASMQVEAKSVGGGTFVITKIDELPVRINGKNHVLLTGCRAGKSAKVSGIINAACPTASIEVSETPTGKVVMTASSSDAFPFAMIKQLCGEELAAAVRSAKPVYYVKRGEALFTSAAQMLATAEKNNWSLGKAALHYETTLLGISEEEAIAEMLLRYDIMRQSVANGFTDEKVDMLLLEPVAADIRRSIQSKRVPRPPPGPWLPCIPPTAAV